MHIIVLLLFVVLAVPVSPSSEKKLILNQQEANKYVLRAEVANLNIAIAAHLSQDQDWIKMEGCKVCDEDKKCDESCFS